MAAGSPSRLPGDKVLRGVTDPESNTFMSFLLPRLDHHQTIFQVVI